jgi:hypothetical protein
MSKHPTGYGNTLGYCPTCGRNLEPAPARSDGEATYVGYYPCRCGSRAEPVYLSLAELRTAPRMVRALQVALAQIEQDNRERGIEGGATEWQVRAVLDAARG